MSAYLNYAALGAVRLSSNALGPVDSIGHPLDPGRYRGVVWRGDSVYGHFTIEVGDEGEGDQVDIDLADMARASEKGATPHFRTGPRARSPVFAVFHCDGDLSGFRAVLTKDDDRKIVFDTAALGPGDYYILTPLKPGRWLIGGTGGAKGAILVHEAKPGDKPRESQSGAMIRADGKTFKPAEVSVASGDGVVFEIAGEKLAIDVVLQDDTGNRTGRRPVGVRYYGRDSVRASNGRAIKRR